jgi:hypothetical protein
MYAAYQEGQSASLTPVRACSLDARDDQEQPLGRWPTAGSLGAPLLRTAVLPMAASLSYLSSCSALPPGVAPAPAGTATTTRRRNRPRSPSLAIR